MTTQAFAMQEIFDFIFQYSDGAQGHMIYKTTMKKLNNEFNCILPDDKQNSEMQISYMKHIADQKNTADKMNISLQSLEKKQHTST